MKEESINEWMEVAYKQLADMIDRQIIAQIMDAEERPKMIAIRNCTEEMNTGKYGEGKQMYTIQINYRPLCVFEHQFEDGLSVCLQKAARAVKRWEKKEQKEKEKS